MIRWLSLAALFIAAAVATYVVVYRQRTAGMVWVPGGDFLMGSDHQLAQGNERPAHKVRVHGFWMDTTHVTNAQFAAFVKATGYVTTAERKPDWETMRVQVPAGTPKPPDDFSTTRSSAFRSCVKFSTTSSRAIAGPVRSSTA